MNHETENETIVRRAREAVQACRERENELRRQLAEARNSTRRAMEKFERLFLENENAERARRMAAG